MGNTWGHNFKVSTWGESHGSYMGVMIDGCPPNIPLSIEDIQRELDKRKPNQSQLTTSRNEPDYVEIVSGVHNGFTLGSPISLLIKNKDMKPSDYDNINEHFRPSHADYTYFKKYNRAQPSGGGRASARETVSRVAAGAIAKKILKLHFNIQIQAFVDRVQDIAMPTNLLHQCYSVEEIEATPIRCPHSETANSMIQRITEIQKQGDSLGGTVFCIVKNTPAGLGAPVFDKLEADLAKGMLSIPASKGFEIGSGFEGTHLTGAQHNDPFITTDQGVRTQTNHSGGIQGGISNGEPIYFRVAFKPTATIAKPQQTVSINNVKTTLLAKGRHDPCVLPRAVPIVEAMAALALIDHAL